MNACTAHHYCENRVLALLTKTEIIMGMVPSSERYIPLTLPLDPFL